MHLKSGALWLTFLWLLDISPVNATRHYFVVIYNIFMPNANWPMWNEILKKKEKKKIFPLKKSKYNSSPYHHYTHIKLLHFKECLPYYYIFIVEQNRHIKLIKLRLTLWIKCGPWTMAGPQIVTDFQWVKYRNWEFGNIYSNLEINFISVESIEKNMGLYLYAILNFISHVQ